MRIRVDRHWRVRTGPLLRRVRRVREAGPRGHPDPDHGTQPRGRASRDPPPPDAVVSQRMGIVAVETFRETGTETDQWFRWSEHSCRDAWLTGYVPSLFGA